MGAFWEAREGILPNVVSGKANNKKTMPCVARRSVPTYSHAHSHSDSRVKVRGMSADGLAPLLKDNAILWVLGISPITFVEAYRTVEHLTTKQLQNLVSTNIKRANTTFRLHSLDRALKGYLTADLPVDPNQPGKFRLIFKHRYNTVKCVGLIDDHADAVPMPTGHEIWIKDKGWPGVSLDELLMF
mmetsp:Transcript_131775/g.196352  ORF Transcript_131775/g.196352 Transcript_131775/m.196352 type:complete len:186 (+) Transcript_131775:163-720(+)